MALPMDDRLLGEKVDNYCSSSSSDSGDDDSEPECDTQVGQTDSVPQVPPVIAGQPQVIPKFHQTTLQTGPKGVLSDYEQFKKLKHLKELEDERALAHQAKKNTMTCRTHVCLLAR